MERLAFILMKNEPEVYSQPVFVHIRGGLPLCVVFIVTLFSTVFIICLCLSEISSIRLERYDFNFTFSAFTRG